jgi:hypothetical protein
MEAEMLALGAKELAAYAAMSFKNGFPMRARVAWQEVIGEYAPDDEASRKALGFVRMGTVWQRDPKFEYPEQDQPNAGVAHMLEQKWDALAQKLGEGHRALAAQLAAAGKTQRGQYHTTRALRFLPKDAKVVAQSGLKQVEGITGDDIDLEILRRSRLMDRAITRLTEQQFAANVVKEENPLLQKAGVSYITVKSEKFTIYGDWEPDVLQQAAAWAERAVAFCAVAYEGYEGFPPKTPPIRKFVFFKQKSTWVDFVRKQQSGPDTDFIVQNASSTMIQDMHACGVEQPEIVYDLAVRKAVWDYSGIYTDAMREGIGHAIVGMFFGRNLVFTVGQQKKEGTVAGGRDEQKLLLPDLDTWRELAVDIAWSQGATAAAKLPLLKAAQFPNDARIKAWSFCDYLLRRDPLLMKKLDSTVSKARTEDEVSARFQELAALPLKQVEERWRRFWTEDSALKRAILEKCTPLEATSKEAPPWLEELNRLRKLWERKPVGWSAQMSVDCKEHVDYLRANKDQRGPDKEQTELAGKPGYSNAGRIFAQSALVWTRDKDPKKAAEVWMFLPGYRDAILNSNVDTVGLYAEGGIMVLDCNRGRIPGDKLTSACFPAANQKGGRARDPVPAAVDVDLLGPEVQRLLSDNQRGKQKQIGYPLTLHLYWGKSQDVTCKVTSQGAAVAGFLVEAKGSNRRTSAQGLWVFYPAEPFKKGVDIRAEWSWAGDSKPGAEPQLQKHDVTFQAM